MYIKHNASLSFCFPPACRDVLPPWCIGSTSLLTSLSRTGKTLRIPRLQLLCDRFLRLIRAGDPLGSNNPEVALGDLEMPPPTLARDLSALVGDPEFADVRFIAEGRAIVAHRFILESRCAYFRGMFRGGMMESRSELIDVVVPGKILLHEMFNIFLFSCSMDITFYSYIDTFVGFLRLLIFIYTGTLPDGSDGALLEDLMAADRYILYFSYLISIEEYRCISMALTLYFVDLLSAHSALTLSCSGVDTLFRT